MTLLENSSITAWHIEGILKDTVKLRERIPTDGPTLTGFIHITFFFPQEVIRQTDL